MTESISSIIHCHFTGLEDNKKLLEQNNAVCMGTDTVVGDKFATIDTFISPLLSAHPNIATRHWPMRAEEKTESLISVSMFPVKL